MSTTVHYSVTESIQTLPSLPCRAILCDPNIKMERNIATAATTNASNHNDDWIAERDILLQQMVAEVRLVLRKFDQVQRQLDDFNADDPLPALATLWQTTSRAP